MNCYDKIKIITNINYISNINTKAFNATLKDDEVIYYKYKQEKKQQKKCLKHFLNSYYYRIYYKQAYY